MEEINILGIDIAKNVFSLCGVDQKEQVVFEKTVKRAKLVETVLQLKPKIIAIEACGSSQYWARHFMGLGIETKLMQAKFVKAYAKNQKNDRHDARAIAEACARPSMRFVGVKTIGHQDIQCIHRVRDRLIKNRTGLCNEIRGFLGEYGIILPLGVSHVKQKLSLYFEDPTLTARGQGMFRDLYDELVSINAMIDRCDQKIKAIYVEHKEVCDRMMKVEGIGILCATALLTVLSEPEVFENGRHFSSYLGLVPRQASSGGKTILRGISKSGNRYIRKLLIHGGRSASYAAMRKKNQRSLWIQNKLETRGPNKTAVAVANKNARIVWALVKHHTQYRSAA